MKLYIGHPTSMKYREDLYRPLKESSLVDEHELVFPHDSDEFFDSKEFLREECDLFVAEVSNPSTGLGIELGWADSFGVPILCICEPGAEISNSLGTVTEEVKRYRDEEELLELVEEAIRR